MKKIFLVLILLMAFLGTANAETVHAVNVSSKVNASQESNLVEERNVKQQKRAVALRAKLAMILAAGRKQ